ncbi:YibE/F family protein [Oceanobacillus manasiensis]|uniref:YibE/F family protein n=1 Tax=Oceanobacillus manasiensis TaxID=586413 RepID=UPI0005A75D4C|nr:YibE/F family protein [Oceanobacillus manasiensis]
MKQLFTKKNIIIYSILAVCFIGSLLFVHNNYSFYDRTIVKVVETNLEDITEISDMHQNEDQIYTQSITAEIKNGEEKGQLIQLTNKYSDSAAIDNEYKAGKELFVKLDANPDSNSELTGSIKDIKRDKYLLIITWLFIFTLLIVGKRQGFYALISLVISAIILAIAIEVYVNTANISLLVICGISIILFTIISLLLVNGFNEKSYAAILATLLGTFLSLLITYLVMLFTSEQGLRYEEMQFLTRPPQLIFMAGLLIGALGAVMDVAITISSSLFGLYEKDNNISIKALKKSGLDIGRDIMGTMTNILFFAYISGSIPMMLLYLRNGSNLSFTFSMNLSLELARALSGGIGIVLTIPIGLYTTIYFINKKRSKP